MQAFEPAYKRIPHRSLGLLELVAVQSRPVHQPWLRLRVLVPANDATRVKIAEAL